MFLIFEKEALLTGAIFSTLLLSIIIKIMICILYQAMINETDNMSTTTNKLLKQCKTKFANCYKLNTGVPNIPVFVDKFINRMLLGKISVHTIYHLSGQLILVSIFLAGVTIAKLIVEGCSFAEIIPFYVISFFALYVYFAVSSFVDISGKRKMLKINLVDYLENHMVGRLESVGVNEKALLEGAKMDEAPVETEDVADRFFNTAQAKELEQLLKEFFTS